MSSDTQRLFVGNLPDDTSEQALRTEFANYGAVRTVEVKQQKDVDTGEIKSTFAFVTISTDDRTLNQCLHEFKQEQYRGRFLKVTVARENFLDKLKREREEAANLQAAKNVQNQKSENENAADVKAALPSFTAKSNAKSSSESSSSSDESSSDEEVATTQKLTKANGTKKQSSSSSGSSDSDTDDEGNDLVLRKRSKIFLENGKIKIDRNVSGGGAIHVIERSTNKTTKKSLDEKSQKADQKRIESLKKMKNSYNEQKLAIKNALAGVDTSKRNNKIVFGDAGDDTNDIGGSSAAAKTATNVNQPEEKAAKKPALFDNDDDEEDEQSYQNDFQIKEQFQGAKGERLLRLQSRFQNDRRFNMDAKFLEDEADYGEDDGNRKPQNGHEATEEDGDDEREWQYDILESVIGKKIRHNEPPKDSAKKKAPPSMLRFDPTRADHTKFVETAKKRPKKADKDDFNAKRRKLDEQDEQDEPKVSMDQFYEIRGDLKKSMGSGGFSLLSMFGRSGDGAGTTQTTETESKYEEKLIPKNNAKFLTDLDPFKYDSSGDEADIGTNSTKKAAGSGAEDASKTTSNGAIWHETFFILHPNDERLNEGIAFFVPAEDSNQPHEIDESKKQELRNIVKRKIKKSVKNALPRHVKPNKRFKRFTKNL